MTRRSMILAAATSLLIAGCTAAPPARWSHAGGGTAVNLDAATLACERRVDQALLSQGEAESPTFILGTTASEEQLWDRVRREEIFDGCMSSLGYRKLPATRG